MVQIVRHQTGYLSTNTYFVFDSKSENPYFFVVDPAGEEETVALVEQHSKTIGLEPDAFVLTHSHFDHLSALPFLCTRFPDAQVLISKAEENWLGPQAYIAHREEFYELDMSFWVDEVEQKSGRKLPEPAGFLEENQVLPFAKDWQILETPGHSKGSVSLYNRKAALLICGDTMFAGGGIGRTDLTGGDYPALCRSLGKLCRLPPETEVFPGHGPKTTIGRETAVFHQN